MPDNGGTERKAGVSRRVFCIAVAAVLVLGFFLGAAFGETLGLAGFLGAAERAGADDGFEEARPRLEQQMRQQKEQEIIMAHVAELREAGDIETHLDAIDAEDEGAVVATVNGEEIRNDELLALQEQEMGQMAMMGLDPESEEAARIIEEMRPQLLDNLIVRALLMQRVEEEGITATEEEVEERYQEIAGQFGGEEMLEQQLEQAGQTAEDLRRQISEQLPLQTYLEDYIEEHLDEDDLDFSEEELREMYEMQQQAQPD